MQEDPFFTKVSKNYCHLDFPLSKREAENFEIKTNDPLYVKRHRFLPFVKVEIVFKKHPDKRNFTNVDHITKVKQKIKIRPISLVSHHDAGIYYTYSKKINAAYNIFSKINEFSDCSVAYRDAPEFKGKSNISIAKEVFDNIDTYKSGWVIKGDFKGFFDNLNHKILNENVWKVLPSLDDSEKDAWTRVLNSLESSKFIIQDKLETLIKEQRGKKVVFRKKDTSSRAYFNTIKDFGEFIRKNQDILSVAGVKGIPQGTSLSAVLANIYMIDFDKRIHTDVKKLGGVYKRYSDDFIIVLPKESFTAEEFNTFTKSVQDLCTDLVQLEIEQDKTKTLAFNEGSFIDLKTNRVTALDYLGFVMSENVVSIRPKSIYKYFYRGKRSVKKAGIARETYRVMMQHKDLSAFEFFEFFIGKGKRQNYFKKQVILRRLQRIKDHVNEKEGLSEIHKVYWLYLVENDDARPRSSYIAYVNKVTEVFNKDSKRSYKVVIQKQLNRQRNKLRKLHSSKNYTIT